MRPVTHVSQPPPARDPHSPPVPNDLTHAKPLSALSEDHRRLIDILQSESGGLTLHQLSRRLSAPCDGVQHLLDGLVERQAVGKLNTVIPTYICRRGGVDLGAD